MPRRFTSVTATAGLAALASLVGLGQSSIAHAEGDPYPQPAEVTVGLDAYFGTGRVNTAAADFRFVRYLEPLDKKDDVVPILRRHVRHPSLITVHVRRDGQTNDTANYLGAGGTFWLGDLSLGGELGGEYVTVLNDFDSEVAYLGLRTRLEAGYRLGELVELGLYYQLRPVIYNLPEAMPGIAEASRQGFTHDAGLSFAASTAGDEWFISGHAGLRVHDWSFSGGFQDGDLTATGVVADARLSYQTNRRLSYYLDVVGGYLDWDNQRFMAPDSPTNVEGELQRGQLTVIGQVGIVFWFEGRWGFRAGLGGGYEAAAPYPRNQDRGILNFAIGFTSRY